MRYFFLDFTVFKHRSHTGVVFSIREVVLCKLNVDGWHLWGKVEGLLITGDHGFGAGATLVCC